MKVAQVVSTFYPEVGGMGQVVKEECGALAALGVEATVYTLRYRAVLSEAGSTAPRVERLRPIIKCGDAGLVPQLIYKLRATDLAHLHYPFYGGAEWVWLAHILYRLPYVVTYHMDAAPVGFMKRAVQKVSDPTLGRLVLGAARRVLAVDAEYFAQSFFGRRLDPKKVIVMSNPINTEVFKPHLVEAGAVGKPDWHNKQILLFVGNLFGGKRLELLLLALQKLPAEVVVAVVGGGYREKEYRRLAATLNLSDRVHFVGRITEGPLLSDWYAISRLVCVPSATESFSLVAAEALATGTPVVASEIPGLRDRLRGGGELFTSGSVPDLARAIQSVLSWSAADRLRQVSAARQFIVRECDSRRHAARLLHIYNEALATG